MNMTQYMMGLFFGTLTPVKVANSTPVVASPLALNPVQLSTTSKVCRGGWLMGQKDGGSDDATPVVNAGAVALVYSPAGAPTNLRAAGVYVLTLAPGMRIPFPGGDLSHWYLVVWNAGDAVQGIVNV